MELVENIAYGVLPYVPISTGLDGAFRVMSIVNDGILCTPIETFISLMSLFGQQRVVYYGAVVTMNILFAIYSKNFPQPKSEAFYETRELLDTYDYIIAGGGAAGCLLANRLSANPNHKVLLIEAGGVPNILTQVGALVHFNQNNPGSGLDWKYFSVKQKIGFQRVHKNDGKYQRSHMGAGKGLGGSSFMNAQMYSRMRKSDLVKWVVDHGCFGWDPEKVWKYFKTHEMQLDVRLQTDNHGITGEVQISTAPKEHNEALVDSFIQAGANVTRTKVILDYNDGVSSGFSRQQTTINVYGGSSHAARSFIDPVREQRPNLHIILHTMVKRILFNGTTAIGVETQPEGMSRVPSSRKKKYYASREVILSAGTARSPQILLLSGVGPKKELDKFNIPQVVELPVGENLHDHIWVLGANLVFPDGKGFCEMSARELRDFFNRKPSFLRAPNAVEAIGFYSTNGTDNRPDIEIFLVEASPNRDESHIYLSSLGISEKDYHSYFKKRNQTCTSQGALICPVLLHSPTRGRVRLQSTNINDHPIFDIQYLAHQEDLTRLVDAMRKSIQMAEEISNHLPYKSHYTTSTVPGCEKFEDKNSTEYLECHIKAYTASIWHMSGTCAMGTGPKYVVDPRLRVYGVQRLRVIDASIFPEQVSGHMVANTYMVGEYGAVMVKEDDVEPIFWNLGG